MNDKEIREKAFNDMVKPFNRGDCDKQYYNDLIDYIIMLKNEEFIKKLKEIKSKCAIERPDCQCEMCEMLNDLIKELKQNERQRNIWSG